MLFDTSLYSYLFRKGINPFNNLLIRTFRQDLFFEFDKLDTLEAEDLWKLTTKYEIIAELHFRHFYNYCISDNEEKLYYWRLIKEYYNKTVGFSNN